MSTPKTTVANELKDTLRVDGSLVTVRYASRSPDSTILRSIQAVDALVARGVRVSQLVIMASDAAAPGPEARAALTESRRRLSGKLLGVAYVIEGDGFAAATHRNALASISLSMRAAHPVKVFVTTAAALAWLKGLEPSVG